MRHGMGDGLDLVDQIERFEIGQDDIARLEAIQPAIGLRHAVVQRRILVEDVDHLEIVPPADLEVVEVVAGRDLDRAGALFGIGMLVGDDRDQPVGQWQTHMLADQILVARILGMHGHGGIAQHGLGARRRHHDEAAGLVLDRIFEMPQMALHLDALDFEIGDGGLQLGVPVDQPLVLVDQALLVQLDEHLQHRL